MKEDLKILNDYPNLAERLTKAGLSQEQAVAAIKVLLESCRYCLDCEHGCQCWNDE